jgi:non-specific serine/threonine protein kinase
MRPDGPAHGMNEEAASCAVLGIGVASLGVAVTRQWGLDDTVLHMMRRLPDAAPVRAVARDEDLLRAVASAAGEAVDAALLAPPAAAAALDRVAQRYARPLGIAFDDLRAAMETR